MKPTPLISVIIPCYNQGALLEEALASVFEQTYSSWECVIINDGSTDDTAQLANQWCEKDGRFSYFFQENKGLSAARNRGLSQAKGEYIQFLDADDKLSTERFATIIEKKGTADILITNFSLLSGTNKDVVIAEPPCNLAAIKFCFEEILMAWEEAFVIPIHAALFRSEIFSGIRFDESLGAREDWLMWLQVYNLPVETVFINNPLALYRMQTGGMSRNRRLMNKNLSLVYQRAFELAPDGLKPRFFQQALEKLGLQLNQAEELLQATQQSRSYRLGNFFVRRFNCFRRFLQPNLPQKN